MSIPKRRWTRFRPVRELRWSRASWERIEPGPTKVRTWAAIALYASVTICIVILLGWLGVLVRQVIRWENLRSRGVNSPAHVLYTQTVDGGDNGDRYYLHALVDACDCVLVVRVTSTAFDGARPTSVRFDPRDHSNAVPLVYRPASTLGIGVAAGVGALALTTALAGSWFHTRRRWKKKLDRSSGESRPVRFQAWKRSLEGSTHYFLLLFDPGASPGADPICCVPVLQLSLRRLRADDVLTLYGHGGQDAVALRREGNVILPSGPVKPGRWEQSLRWE
jgi:hypothetical protein